LVPTRLRRTIGPIARLLLFARRPYHLSDAEADRWMRTQAASLVRIAAVNSVDLSRIDTPAVRGGEGWDWLVEMHVDRGEDGVQAARDPACRDLVADLRLLGMQPSLVLADGTRPLEG
jgi:hypothetical protein